MGGGPTLGEVPFGYRWYPTREGWLPTYEPYFNPSSYYDELNRRRQIEELRRNRNRERGLGSMRGNSTPSAEYMEIMQPFCTNENRPPSSNYPINAGTTNQINDLPATMKASTKPRVISVPVTDVAESDCKVAASAIPKVCVEKTVRDMSVDRAAVTLQSRFRGFLVRKTKPLSHLRIIASVKAKWKELREQTFSPNFLDTMRDNFKTRVTLTESIMHLLLQLDSIQGAHPVVRQIRKAVTKDVIDLQEKVDSCLSGNAPTDVEASSSNNDFDVSTEGQRVDFSSSDQEKPLTVDEAGVATEEVDGLHDSKVDFSSSYQEQPLTVNEAGVATEEHSKVDTGECAGGLDVVQVSINESTSEQQSSAEQQNSWKAETEMHEVHRG